MAATVWKGLFGDGADVKMDALPHSPGIHQLVLSLLQVEVGGKHLAAVQCQEQRVTARARRLPVVRVLVGSGVVAQTGAAGCGDRQSAYWINSERTTRGALERD